jgi:hypothetical protein
MRRRFLYGETETSVPDSYKTSVDGGAPTVQDDPEDHSQLPFMGEI